MATIAEKVALQEEGEEILYQMELKNTIKKIKKNLMYWEDLILSNKWEFYICEPSKKAQRYPFELLYDYFKQISCSKRLGEIAFIHVMKQQGITIRYSGSSIIFLLPA